MKQSDDLVTIVLCRVNTVIQQYNNGTVVSDDNDVISLLAYFL